MNKNQREVLKVSLIVAIAIHIVQFFALTDLIESTYITRGATIIVIGLVVSGLILYKRLEKENWLICAGVILTFVAFMIISWLLHVLF